MNNTKIFSEKCILFYEGILGVWGTLALNGYKSRLNVVFKLLLVLYLYIIFVLTPFCTQKSTC